MTLLAVDACVCVSEVFGHRIFLLSVCSFVIRCLITILLGREQEKGLAVDIFCLIASANHARYVSFIRHLQGKIWYNVHFKTETNFTNN